MEATITITPKELKKLITEAISEGKTNSCGTIFNKSSYIIKRKHELHMTYPCLREMINKEATYYHPIPDKFKFASENHFNGKPSFSKLGPANPVHELARKFALMCFGVSTNNALSSQDEEKAVNIYNELIEMFFNNYEKHLNDKFSSQ